MANENDYQDKCENDYIQFLRALIDDQSLDIGSLEKIISNREAEIDRLQAENRFLRDQLKSEWLKIEVNK